MRITIEKLVKKLLAMYANPEEKESAKAKKLKEFLNENDYVSSYKKFIELETKILELEAEKALHLNVIKTVVEYKF